MNYQSIRSIFPTLPLDRSQIDEHRILEWATEAYESLNLKQEYENKVAIINVTNHKGFLPYGINQIMSVTYLHNQNPSINDLQSICEILDSEDAIACGCSTNVGNVDEFNPSTDPVTYYAPNQYNIQRVKSQGILNNYSLWNSSIFFKNNFSLMKLTKRPFTNKIHCSDCPNLSCMHCEYTYDISPYGEIITEFSEGVVCISYKSIPIDDEGLVMIPDDPDVRKALNFYVSAKHWELRYNMKEEGASERYRLFLQQAEMLMMKVKGKFGIKHLDYQSIVFIGDRYKRLINQPIVWNFNNGVTLE